MRYLPVALVAVLAGAPGVAAAQQPLAEVARAEEARRGAIAKPSPVYTNRDLRPEARRLPAPGTPAEPRPAPAAPAVTPPAQVAGTVEAPTPAEDAPPMRDEAWWRARITAARVELERSRLFAEALQSRINALTTDYVNRDDPAQRAQLEQERRTALAELQRVRGEVDRHTLAIAAIEEEARRAGVPPGWLR